MAPAGARVSSDKQQSKSRAASQAGNLPFYSQ